MNTKEAIIEYIVDELLDDDEDIQGDTSLFEGRILDSIKLLELISELESSNGIKIGTSEVNLDNLDSVDKIVAFLGRKRGE